MRTPSDVTQPVFGDSLLWPITLALLTTLASTATAFALLLSPAAIGG